MTYIPGDITTSDGLRLVTKSWPIQHAKANILFVHGYAEHCGRFAHIAKFFNNHGYNFYGYDQRAHGMSEGDMGYIKNIDFLVNDLKLFSDHIIEDEKPFYFLSHSMGGLITLSHVLLKKEKKKNLRGLVLSAPFIRPPDDLAPILQKLAQVLGIILPRLKTIAIDPKDISRDPSVVKDYSEDSQVYHGRIHARTGQQLQLQTKILRPHYNELDIPFLVMHGTHDKLAAYEGSADLYKESKSQDKQFISLENFKHDIMNELGSHRILQSIVNWMDERI